MNRSLAFLLIGICVVPAAANAQTVIMRKPIGDAVFGSGPGGYQKPNGGTATPAPSPSPMAGSWTTTAPRAITPSCSAEAPATRDVWCAGPGGGRLADANCASAGPRPSSTTTISDYTGCGYVWQPVGQTTWSSTCSDRATATRSYVCQRQDGVTVPASSCDTSHRETETETAANLTACEYEVSAWQTTSYSSTCSAKSERTFRATNCMRFGGGEAPQQVAVEQCQAAGVAITKTDTVPVYDGCTYQPTYSTTYSACVGGEQSAPIVSCRRSDDTDVPIAECSASKQTTTRTCVAARTCGAFVQPMAVTGISANGTSTTIGDAYAATHDLRMTAARTLCEKAAPPATGSTLAYCQTFEGYADKTRVNVRGNWNTGTPAAKYTISTDASSYAAFSNAACSGG